MPFIHSYHLLADAPPLLGRGDGRSVLGKETRSCRDVAENMLFVGCGGGETTAAEATPRECKVLRRAYTECRRMTQSHMRTILSTSPSSSPPSS